MRYSILASFLVIAACHKDPGTGDDTITPDAPGTIDNAAFSVQSTDVVLTAGQEVTYCYYFHTPNTAPIAVNKWVSDMTPGSHHMIFFTGGPAHADGLDMSNSCGLGSSTTNVSQWVFASQTPHTEELLPPDDGAGKPLAQVIQPNTLGAFQMHYLNATDGPLTVHVKLSAYALADATSYTRTDAYITYNNVISIPPGATNVAVTASCDAPPGKFWLLSTHAHKQAIKTEVLDGSSSLFSSTEWEHPGAKEWDATPFYTMAANKVTWTCTYDNTGDNSGHTIVAGPSAQTNEMCMATGYYFPSTAPKICLNYAANSCICQ
jgi:hypothetical protein